MINLAAGPDGNVAGAERADVADGEAALGDEGATGVVIGTVDDEFATAKFG